MPSNPDPDFPAGTSPSARLILLTGSAAGVAALAWGMFQYDLIEQLPTARAIELLRMLAAIGFGGLLLALLSGRPLALGLIGSFLIVTLAIVGPAPVIAALLLLGSAASLGFRLFARDSSLPAALRVTAGLALVGLLIGWLIPFPVHHRLVYLLGVLALVLPQWRRLFDTATAALASLDAAMRRQPLMACVAVVALIAGAMPAWLPSLMYDDLGYHLGLPHQLHANGYYRMDAASQVWAFGPWLGDCIFAVGYVLAGEDARGSINLVWLGLASVLLFQLVRRLWPDSERAAWMAVALFASLPINAVLVAGMQTELIGSTLLLATLGILHACRHGESSGRTCLAMLLLAAGMVLTKTSMLPFVVVLLAWYGWQQRGRLPRWPRLMLFPAALLLGGSAYLYAYLFTGNPILPLANGVFQSPYFPESNFSNPVYLRPLTAENVWALLFDSGSFYESRDGVSGFHWLVLLVPALIAATLRPRLWVLILIGLSAAAVQYSAQSYLRYLMPAMLLLIPACAAGASLLGNRLGTPLLIAVVGLNLAFQSNAHWVLREGGVFTVFSGLGKDESLRDWVAPELRLIDLALLQQADAQVLLTSRARPFASVAAGQAFTTSWYDTELNTAFASGESGAVLGMLDRFAFTHVLVHPEGSPNGVLEALDQASAEPIAVIGPATLWRMPDRTEPAVDLLRSRDRNALAVARSIRERYREWHRGRKLRHPERYQIEAAEPASSR